MNSTRIDSRLIAAWRSFLTAHSEIVDAMNAELEAEAGIPLNWYEVLLYLREADDGRLRMHELAESLLLSRSAATRFVDRMETAGLVTRKNCVSDRRGTFVTMTDKGREVFAGAAPIHMRGIDEYFTRFLSPEDADLLQGIFQRMIDSRRST